MSDASPHHLEDWADRIRPSQAANLLLWLVVGFFAILLLWAAFTRLDRSVHGQGRVVPTAQLQTVSNLEGGIVEAILVRAGDNVRAGAPLVRLDRTMSGAELGSGQETIQALEAKVARLQAELDGHAPRFAAGAGGAAGDRAGAVALAPGRSRQSLRRWGGAGSCRPSAR